MITVPGFIPWLRYVVYSSSEGPECHLSHHHNYLQINGKNAFSYAIKLSVELFSHLHPRPAPDHTLIEGRFPLRHRGGALFGDRL
jgi:hypothetical protein